MPLLICPVCEKDDAIQKISSILGESTISTQYQMPTAIQIQGKTYYGSSSQTAISQTHLAKKVSPPQKPVFKGVFLSSEQPQVSELGEDIFSGLLVIVGWLLIAAIVTGGVAGFLAGVLNLKDYALAIPSGVTFFVSLMVIIFRRIKKERTITSLVRSKVPDWERAMEKWRRSYYCARNDCVFDPESGDSAQVEELERFLYA